MTRSQISNIFTTKSIPFNQWVPLDDVFKYLMINSDRTLFCNAPAAQFYFPSTTGDDYLLMRYTAGNPKLAPEGYTLKAGEVALAHPNGSTYIVKLNDGGKEDPTAGVYHEIVAFEHISGFMIK
jgi:hypothetical protein